jgi:CHAT domain-containing protein/Flp pilus assembly protein TadD
MTQKPLTPKGGISSLSFGEGLGVRLDPITQRLNISKTMKHLLLLLTLCSGIATSLQAQTIPQNPNKTDKNGLRQGKWTICYDKDWKPLTDCKQATYYRLLSYQDDKPTGKVRDYYLSGVVQWEGTLLADRPEEVMDGEAIWYDEQGNKSTVRVFEKGKLLSEKNYNPDGTEKKAEAGNQELNQALADYKAEKYTEALPIFEKYRKIFEEALKDKPDNLKVFYEYLATCYQKTGRQKEYEALLPYIQKQETPTPTEGSWKALNQAGMQAYQAGDYQKAIEIFEKAKVQAEKEFGSTHPDYATSLNNLALLYQAKGDYAQAEPLYQKVIEIEKIALGESHPDYASSLNNLAELYRIKGDYAQAGPLYQKASEVYKIALGEHHPDYASSLNNLAVLYKSKGDYAQAEPLFQKALDIRKIALGESHPDYASSLNNLAGLYESKGDYAQAGPLYQKASEVYKIALGESHPDYATSLNNLAALYESKGDYAQADSLLRQASQVLIKQTESNFSNLSEKEKGLFLQTFNYNFEAYNSFTLKAHQQIPTLTGWLYNNTLAIKGLLFQSSEKMRQAILRSGDKALIAQWEAWKAKKEYLARVATLTLADKQKQGIDEAKLEAEANDLEKQLSLRASNLSGLGDLTGLGGDKTRYTWQDVQKSLQPGEAAVEIIRTEYYDKKWTDSVLYIALIVKPETKGQPEMMVLPNGKELEDKYFRTYQNSIQSKLRDDRSYSRFWQPIADKIPDTKKVYFSGDGIYNQLNISTLYNPNTEKYVLEELDIQLVGNTKELVKRARAKPSKPLANSAVLLGRPQYDLSAEAHLQASKNYRAERDLGVLSMGDLLKNTQLSDLPGTETEVRNIQTYLKQKGWQTELYIQANAVEEVIKKTKYPRVLHIATHGFFFSETQALQVADTTTYMGGNDDLSIKFSNEERTDRKTRVKQQAQIEAMLRSGLVLAGVSTYAKAEKKYATEDGILTAYEAMNLNLDNTELVVLSACETGLGDVVAGEGVYGLQRAFQQAGAKTVLISLWKVSDDATQLLMRTFYENWLQGKTKREAFRLAQDKLKNSPDYKNPYFWGAFVMVGE